MSPRVREESVHPRLQSAASGRPLNFTVRCHCDTCLSHSLSILVNEPKWTPLKLFLLFFTLGVVYYLLDCLFEFKRYPDLPWYETGMRSGPRGFLMSIGLVAAAFYFLIFGKEG